VINAAGGHLKPDETVEKLLADILIDAYGQDEQL
jgi:hypothetical protein